MRNFSGGKRFGGGGRNDRGGRGGFKPREYGRDDRSERKMYSAICDNCGKRCEVPFKPTGEKPVYCDDCFGRPDNYRNERSYNDVGDYFEGNKDKKSSFSSDNNQDYKELFAQLNKKLDTVIELLTLIADKRTVRIGKPAPEVIASPLELDESLPKTEDVPPEAGE